MWISSELNSLRASANEESALWSTTPLSQGAKNTGVSCLNPAVDDERRRKGKEQASSSVPTGKGQTDDKRSKSLEARPATRVKIPCLCVARCRKSSFDYRHVS